jgi:hypothetical protein
LGRELFDRRSRGVVPTSVTDQSAAQAAAPLDAPTVVADRGALGVGRSAEPVHVAGPAESLCTRVLPALASPTGEGVRLRVSPGLADALLDGLRGGRFELVIATARPRGRTLTWEPSADEAFVLVAPPAWAARIGAGRVAAEGPAVLHGVPLVSYTEDRSADRAPLLAACPRHPARRAGRAGRDHGARSARGAGGGRGRCRDHRTPPLSLPLPLTGRADVRRAGGAAGARGPADQHLVPHPAPGLGSPDNPHVTLVRELLLQAAPTW